MLVNCERKFVITSQVAEHGIFSFDYNSYCHLWKQKNKSVLPSEHFFFFTALFPVMLKLLDYVIIFTYSYKTFKHNLKQNV